MPNPVDRWLRIHEVFHPTDCSQGSEVALVHALRIACVAEARLTLMRVGPEGGPPSDDSPDVRARLDQWRARSPRSASIPEIAIRWLAATGNDPARSCLKSLERSPAELIVVATHTRDGKTTWLGKSVAEPLARSSGEMTLLVPEGAAGFVRPEDGAVTLKSVLVPVASQPRPEPAIEAARRLMLSLPEAGGTATALYVGDPSGMPELQLPEMPGWKWNRLVAPGDVVDAILQTAADVAADLVAMTTKGRHGFLDALRGSTTERVLRQARCPMLTMPVGSFLG
ncbi:MAG: universal stress protein [Pirellulales bacterium]|nr:universal stress protein [Pirellulales bacterium]